MSTRRAARPRIPAPVLQSSGRCALVSPVQDAIAGFQAAPLWAQMAIALFAIMVIVAIVEPPLHRWRYRRRFDEIVRGLGQATPRDGGWPVTSTVSVDGRAFELRYDIRAGGRGSSYRGPRGHLLTTATRLAGTRWPLHQVDISRLEGLLARFVASKRLTGDGAFDERFYVVEDGAPVRKGWLDAARRQAITRFFDETRLRGLIWIRNGELQFIIQPPWKGIDGPAMRALLGRQAVLAAALERTAGTPV
jgi:hypothetical protein